MKSQISENLYKKLQRQYSRRINLDLSRIKKVLQKLGDPQDRIKVINVVGTNGKNSTIQACLSILKEANINCNVYTSPHIQKINERFVFNNNQLKDDELASLFLEVEKINNDEPITKYQLSRGWSFF